MTKSELIEVLSLKHDSLTKGDVELSVNLIIDEITSALTNNARVEVRGFGSFTNHFRKEKVGRNPKTGERVNVAAQLVPFFKPGKELRSIVNKSMNVS